MRTIFYLKLCCFLWCSAVYKISLEEDAAPNMSRESIKDVYDLTMASGIPVGEISANKLIDGNNPGW